MAPQTRGKQCLEFWTTAIPKCFGLMQKTCVNCLPPGHWRVKSRARNLRRQYNLLGWGVFLSSLRSLVLMMSPNKHQQDCWPVCVIGLRRPAHYLNIKESTSKIKCKIDFTVAMTTDRDVRSCQRLNLLKMSRMMILDAEWQLLSFLNQPLYIHYYIERFGLVK